MKIIGSAVRAGNIIEYDGKIWRVVKHNVVSPGKGSKEMQYLFNDGDAYTFMDQESFEQTTVNRDLIGEAADFLTDNMVCTVNLIESEVVGVTLPQSTVCTVVEADAVVKGQTASSSYKPAVLDNGAKIMVPPFIAAGTRIVVNIEERTYLERAKD
jgi:elongation factor P